MGSRNRQPSLLKRLHRQSRPDLLRESGPRYAPKHGHALARIITIGDASSARRRHRPWSKPSSRYSGPRQLQQRQLSQAPFRRVSRKTPSRFSTEQN